MYKISLALILVISALGANAQFVSAFENDSTAKHAIELTGDYGISSNSITNSFFSDYYFGNFITDAKKNSVIDNLADMNNFGGDINYGISYIHLPSTGKIFGLNNAGYFVSLKNRGHIDGSFSNDLFKVLFNGNQEFRGKTAEFNDFSFNYLSYQQLELGLIKNFKCGESKMTAGLGLSYLNGQNHFSIQVGKSNLFTHEDGDYVDFLTDMTIHRSDTSNKDFGVSNGQGVSTHLFFSYEGQSGTKIKFAVSDLGFIKWNDNSSTVKLDTSFHFEGIEVNNIFDFDDPAYTNTPSDTGYIRSFLNHRTYGSYNSALPALFQLSFDKKYDNITLLTGLKYRMNANYIPYLFVGGQYNFNPTTYASATLGFGGYARLNVGIEGAKKLFNSFTILAGINYVNAIVTPSTGRGQGAYISLKKTF